MTNENGNALELLECYESCMAGEAGRVEFIYLAENEAEVVKEFNAIYIDVRKNHRGVMSVSIDQAKNKIVFTKVGDSKTNPQHHDEIQHYNAVEISPETKTEVLKNDWTDFDVVVKPEGDCETPEDCEDGCKEDCEDGFDGDNLT